MLRVFAKEILNGRIVLDKPFLEKASNRKVWDAIPSNSVAHIIKFAEEHLNYNWPSFLATNFLAFERTGDRMAWQKPMLERRHILANLIIAECIEYKGRFLDDITNGIILTCEETYWGYSAHRYGGTTGIQQNYDPYIDLHAANTGSLLAAATYLLSDELHPTVIERALAEIKFRILDAFLKHDDFWWQGIPSFPGEKRLVNNWNSWICQNLMFTYLLASENEEYMHKGIAKVMDVLSYFIDALPQDGGCDEGAAYWFGAAGAMFVALEQLYTASRGKINIYDNEKIKKSGNFFAKMFISEKYIVNFNDAYHKKDGGEDWWILFWFGKRTNNPILCDIGKRYWKSIDEKIYFPPQFKLYNIFALFSQEEICSYEFDVQVEDSSFLEDLQILTVWQDRKSTKGLFLATKGGHNDESHNHNDVGTITVYADGEPLLVDPGMGIYTKNHFNENRYDIWNHQSSWHNLPEINGAMQSAGRNYTAKNVSVTYGDVVNFDVDLEDAWHSDSGLEKYHRNVKFDKINGIIIVSDIFEFANSNNKVTENLIISAPCEIKDEKLVVSMLNDTKCQIAWDFPANARIEYKDVSDDELLDKMWENGLCRVRLSIECEKKAVLKYSVKII